MEMPDGDMECTLTGQNGELHPRRTIGGLQHIRHTRLETAMDCASLQHLCARNQHYKYQVLRLRECTPTRYMDNGGSKVEDVEKLVFLLNFAHLFVLLQKN